jgi:hypothetical protein
MLQYSQKLTIRPYPQLLQWVITCHFTTHFNIILASSPDISRGFFPSSPHSKIPYAFFNFPMPAAYPISLIVLDFSGIMLLKSTSHETPHFNQISCAERTVRMTVNNACDRTWKIWCARRTVYYSKTLITTASKKEAKISYDVLWVFLFCLDGRDLKTMEKPLLVGSEIRSRKKNVRVRTSFFCNPYSAIRWGNEN